MNCLDTNNAIFKQDNATIHTSKLMKDCFKTKNIEVLDCLTKSPDLNPIENYCQKEYTKIHVNLKIEKF